MRRRSLPLASERRLWRRAALILMPLVCVSGAAFAQAHNRQQPPGSQRQSDALMEADSFAYDEQNDTLIATGHVEIARAGNVLMADRVSYDQKRDVATATGHVTLIEPNGTTMFADRADVTGDLKQAIAEDMRVLLADRSRMTARAFRRVDEATDELYEAAYTACDVCANRSPVWKVEAKTVRRDTDKRMIYYHDAWLDVMGVPVFYTPYLATPDPTAGRKSGFLMPSIGGNANVGLAYGQPYYINIAPDKDATLETLLTTAAGKGLTAEYREDFAHGQLRLFGSGVGDDPATDNAFRGHIASSARWDIDDNWRSGADVNLATDQTYLRRYNFDRIGKTWLTTSADVERFDTNSYFSATSYYFQRQRDVIALPSPVISPLMYYNYTSNPFPWGGYLKFDANGLVLTREDGTDSDRLSGILSYDLPFRVGSGHLFNFHIAYRADGYYVSDYALPTTGQNFTGTTGRTQPEASLTWRYPLVRPSSGFTQVIEPIVMLYTSPIAKNNPRIPNEDSIDVEFDDTNLFSNHRFTGFDRVEGGSRVSYGLQWGAYNGHGGSISALIGQSYRFNARSPFAAGSGLDTKFSDYVGRVEVSPNSFMNFEYRFRLDHETFAARRSEISAAFGPEILRVIGTYIDIPAAAVAMPVVPSGFTTPIDQPKELNTVVSTKLSRYWNLSAGYRTSLNPGGGTVGANATVQYEDECFALYFTIAQNNTSDRDFKGGVSVLLRFSLKTIGDLRLSTLVGSP